MNSKRYLVTTVLADRVGIIRDVSGALFALGANLTDVRQAVIGGMFVLNAIAEFEAPRDAGEIRAKVSEALAGASPAAGISVLPCGPAVAQSGARTVDGDRYVASFSGPDRPGRIHAIAEIFARHGANVEDWRHDLSDPARTLTIGVVTLAAGSDPLALQDELRDAFAPLGLATSLLHENIFRATNEVGPIVQLFGGRSNGVSRNA
ncbi:MAG: glycine cleavage system protein R [Kiritimatiellia bacterium]|jgi:glycine cleavage system transcriptional repressor